MWEGQGIYPDSFPLLSSSLVSFHSICLSVSNSDGYSFIPNMSNLGHSSVAPFTSTDVVHNSQAHERTNDALHHKWYQGVPEQHAQDMAASKSKEPTPRNSSALLELKNNPKKAGPSATLPLRLSSLPNHTVSGSWSMKDLDYFVVSSGCLELFQKVVVGGIEFEVSGWSGCGRDFLTLSLSQKGEINAYLVIPDARVHAHAILWACPLHYSIFRVLYRCMGWASKTCQTRFGLILVSFFFLLGTLLLFL